MSEKTLPSRRTRNVQSGPRAQNVIEAVRYATLAELDRAGYAHMTMDGVARAAGINRTTLYRRWPNKAALLAALLDSEIDRFEAPPLPDSLGPALEVVLAVLADNLARPEGLVLMRTLTAAEPDLRALAQTARHRTIAHLRLPFVIARDNGEIAPETDIDMLAHLLFSGAVLWGSEGRLDAAARQRLMAPLLRAVGLQ